MGDVATVTSEQTTEEIPTQSPSAEPAPPAKPRGGRFWRELAGALAAGLAILAFAVLVLQIISWANGVPGLGVIELIGHIIAAALAIANQRFLDRHTGRAALFSGLAQGLIALAVLVLFWWI